METQRKNLDDSDLYLAILDSLATPVVFVDRQHYIRHMNTSGKKQYSKYGNIVGKSIFDCHNPASAQNIKEIYIQLQLGADEGIYSEKESARIYMRAVRDCDGDLLGYYERYEERFDKPVNLT
jgi:DUF438 domain-containing protein